MPGWCAKQQPKRMPTVGQSLAPLGSLSVLQQRPLTHEEWQVTSDTHSLTTENGSFEPYLGEEQSPLFHVKVQYSGFALGIDIYYTVYVNHRGD